MGGVDVEGLSAAYQDVRNDDSQTSWAAFEYNSSNTIVVKETGTNYDDLLKFCDESVRLYIFARVQTGDDLSVRSKFVFICWIGERVSPLKKAKMSTDKAEVKKVIQNFAKEMLASEKSEINYSFVQSEVRKAGGANYGSAR
ncbi:coactosin-like protein [Sycon ciliatum]|uniref:coactosin-like protein n=1 Tax=Sycon ciliatum TaxID=27933 RepID=UPI0031F64EE0